MSPLKPEEILVRIHDFYKRLGLPIPEDIQNDAGKLVANAQVQFEAEMDELIRAGHPIQMRNKTKDNRTDFSTYSAEYLNAHFLIIVGLMIYKQNRPSHQSSDEFGSKFSKQDRIRFERPAKINCLLCEKVLEKDPMNSVMVVLEYHSDPFRAQHELTCTFRTREQIQTEYDNKKLGLQLLDFVKNFYHVNKLDIPDQMKDDFTKLILNAQDKFGTEIDHHVDIYKDNIARIHSLNPEQLNELKFLAIVGFTIAKENIYDQDKNYNRAASILNTYAADEKFFTVRIDQLKNVYGSDWNGINQLLNWATEVREKNQRATSKPSVK